MQRTRCSLLNFVLDTPSKQLRATSRKVEHWRTRHLKESKETTNSYHKEQYINAFLEAQSAAMMHRHAVEVAPSAQAALTRSSSVLTASRELTALALELEAKYSGKATAASHFSLMQSDEALPRRSLEASRGQSASCVAPIEFGAWRSAAATDARLRQKIRSVDVVRHCVIREARTPPELSPEVIERALPRRPPPAVQRLLAFVQSRSFRAATTPVEMDRLCCGFTAALRALKHSRELQKSVALFVVFSLSCYREWSTAAPFVLWLHAQWPSLANFPAAASPSAVDPAMLHVADSSHFVALLFDTLRWASAVNAALLPTLEEAELFCDAAHRALAESTGGGGVVDEKDHDGPLWSPVVAAPLLSVVGLREGVDTPLRNSTQQLQRFADRYCIRRSMPSSYYHEKKKAAPLAYMPALAWGEYLRALHRCGASLLDLQAATDNITDAGVTRHARQLLSNTHVWNAYLACCPGPHALEVYERNRGRYHVQDTPATIAAVMTALLNAHTAETNAQARTLWSRLRKGQPAKKMITGTCSTVVAHARLLQAEGNAAAVRALLTSYEDLYECFGVPHEWFQQQRKELAERESRGRERAMADGLRVLLRASAAFPLLIPPAVQVALVQAARETGEEAAGISVREREVAQDAAALSSPAEPPELTAEDLAAMM
ncbi:hypothetical protein ABB37_09538 [Leptomonas pyrrhocoris]|uniref:Uncharacterized protein n=1 Tax=Leptomonas pyrrhocoris TaxID=157538 RepID=A0A0N0VCV9_LEPPY|nr:hypothetical protein ABB37_09538 [Leptomonas pyrrhocoris]KPA73952.1 hypothetical protein ABB37_09538 [Leptomonas pyrrhocoris]|eukprot:XP_015652391.1 hypothetical protein ABB37_09538 [Leptomonas pyrrhocoris]